MHRRFPLGAYSRGIVGSDAEQVLARRLLGGGGMELVFSILDNLVAVAVAIELVGIGLLIHRKLR